MPAGLFTPVQGVYLGNGAIVIGALNFLRLFSGLHIE